MKGGTSIGSALHGCYLPTVVCQVVNESGDRTVDDRTSTAEHQPRTIRGVIERIGYWLVTLPRCTSPGHPNRHRSGATLGEVPVLAEEFLLNRSTGPH